MPMRKRVARAELEATKLEVGDQVLKLSAEVRAAFLHRRKPPSRLQRCNGW